MLYSEDEKELHVTLMKSILEEISNKKLPTYLKGGTALLLCYGLDRFSEDIDLNSEINFNLENVIKIASQKVKIEISEIKILKDTNTTKRYKVFYNNRTLKIETSFRDKIEKSGQLKDRYNSFQTTYKKLFGSEYIK